jgi:hypothetical protein
MIEYIATSFGRQFAIDECIEACAELIVTLQRFKSCPDEERQGVAQADLSHVILWCGIASVFFGREEVAKSACEGLYETYRIICARRGATYA